MTGSRKHLVTGGAGFIGHHLARALASAGDEVVVMDTLRTGRRENLGGIPCSLIEADIREAGTHAELFAGVDTVFHLAALVSVEESTRHPRETCDLNTTGTVAVAEAARAAGVRRIVFASTCAIYGSATDDLLTEESRPAPESPYAASKLAAEQYLDLYTRTTDMEVTVLRFFNVYGPGQDPRSPYAGVVSIFLENLRQGRALRIFGDGGQTRDFVHVSDVAAAVAAAADTAPGTYHVATGRSITIRELAEAVAAMAPGGLEIEHHPPRAGDVRHSRGNADRLRATGWTPQVPLEAGLRAMVPGA